MTRIATDSSGSSVDSNSSSASDRALHLTKKSEMSASAALLAASAILLTWTYRRNDNLHAQYHKGIASIPRVATKIKHVGNEIKYGSL